MNTPQQAGNEIALYAENFPEDAEVLEVNELDEDVKVTLYGSEAHKLFYVRTTAPNGEESPFATVAYDRDEADEIFDDITEVLTEAIKEFAEYKKKKDEEEGSEIITPDSDIMH